MALRESGRARNETYDLRGVVDPTVDIGVENCDLLCAFTDCVLGTDRAELDRARTELVSAMGDEALVSASIIAANFSMNDRIANAIGIPMEEQMVNDSADFRERLGINAYRSATNSLSNTGR